MRLRTRHTLAVALVAAMAAVTALVAAPAVAVSDCTPSASWGTNRADLASQVVQLINQHRASIGRSQLSLSSSLAASATWKSLHMAAYRYFAHDDPAPPVARSAYKRATDCGYAGSSWGENIAWGYTSAQSVVQGWLSSPGHRANIESASYTSTGVGAAANASGSLYWTQVFGNDAGVASPPTPSTPPASVPPPSSTPPPSTPPPPAPAQPASPPSSASPVTPSPAPAASGTSPAPAPTAALPIGGMPAHVTSRKRTTRLLASVSFVHLTTGKPLAAGSVRCRAEVGGRRLRVLANVFRGKAASCAWRVPAWARGKVLTGVVAVQVGDAAATRLFVRQLP